MSDGDFERFLRSARADGTPTGDDARRVERKLASKISFNKALPLTAAAAFRAATARAAFTETRFGLGPYAWTKIVSVTAALGLVAGASYFAVSTSHGPTGTNTTTNSASGGDHAPNVATSDVVHPSSEPSRRSDDETTAPTTSDTNQVATANASDHVDSGMLVVDDPAKLPVAKPQGVATTARATTSAAGATASAARAANSGSAQSLDAELALLAQTSAALRAHDPARALALAASHEKNFPHGALGPEFAAQRVLSLSALGRRAEACSEATRFLAQNPNSPLASQVRQVCDETSSP